MRQQKFVLLSMRLLLSALRNPLRITRRRRYVLRNPLPNISQRNYARQRFQLTMTLPNADVKKISDHHHLSRPFHRLRRPNLKYSEYCPRTFPFRHQHTVRQWPLRTLQVGQGPRRTGLLHLPPQLSRPSKAPLQNLSLDPLPFFLQNPFLNPVFRFRPSQPPRNRPCRRHLLVNSPHRSLRQLNNLRHRLVLLYQSLSGQLNPMNPTNRHCFERLHLFNHLHFQKGRIRLLRLLSCGLADQSTPLRM